MSSPPSSRLIPVDAYARFAAAVARRQLAEWLDGCSGPLLDLTPGTPCAQGGTDLPVVAMHRELTSQPTGTVGGVRGDDMLLDCLQTASVGAVVAEQGSLVGCLALEETLRRVHRVLQPGGSVLLCVDSLVHGMAALAAAARWAELADAPRADVVIVGDTTAGLSRCFSPVELSGCVHEAGLVLDWVRPRTVLAAETVNRAVTADPSSMDSLVAAELSLAVDRAGAITGRRLLVSAHR